MAKIYILIPHQSNMQKATKIALILLPFNSHILHMDILRQFCVPAFVDSSHHPIRGSFYQRSGLPRWLSGIESACHCRRRGFDLWVWKNPWRRKWPPTSVFLPGKSHGQWSLASYSPQSMGSQRIRPDLATK